VRNHPEKTLPAYLSDIPRKILRTAGGVVLEYV
jgi:hypothetical protein